MAFYCFTDMVTIFWHSVCYHKGSLLCKSLEIWIFQTFESLLHHFESLLHHLLLVSTSSTCVTGIKTSNFFVHSKTKDNRCGLWWELIMLFNVDSKILCMNMVSEWNQIWKHHRHCCTNIWHYDTSWLLHCIAIELQWCLLLLLLSCKLWPVSY